MILLYAMGLWDARGHWKPSIPFLTSIMQLSNWLLHLDGGHIVLSLYLQDTRKLGIFNVSVLRGIVVLSEKCLSIICLKIAFN